MCEVGDIIFIEKYRDRGTELSQHSFVVISTEEGSIGGMDYTMICNVLSSFKSKEQKKRKLSYPGNYPVANKDTITSPDNGKDGYIKTDQLYYFDKDLLDYVVIGTMKQNALRSLLDFIENGDFSFVAITDNLISAK